MNLLAYGPRAVLAELDGIEEVIATAAAWRAALLPGVVEIVPAATTVLVVHDGTLDLSLLVPVADRAAAPMAELVLVPVRYDGDDLVDVATACGLSVDAVIQLHSGAEYTSAFCGFIAGFGYLVGLDERLVLPRRSTPRTRVPAGSVAMASTFTGVYPVASPGGWHLLGRTDLPMWVPDREVPATLPPGSRVRFVPT